MAAIENPASGDQREDDESVQGSALASVNEETDKKGSRSSRNVLEVLGRRIDKSSLFFWLDGIYGSYVNSLPSD